MVVALALLVSALISVLVVGGAEAWSNGADGRRCDRFARASLARAGIVTGSGERILVIGDSWSAGHDLADPGKSWPSELPGRVHVDGFSGSGFSRGASPCPGRAYADRVDQALQRTGARPDLVILQGGLNETDRPDEAIRAGVRRVVARLEQRGIGRRDIVIVGPVAAPRRAAGVPRVDRLLAEEADRAGVRYLSVVGVKLPYLQDRLHPTARGHAQFGDTVAALL